MDLAMLRYVSATFIPHCLPQGAVLQAAHTEHARDRSGALEAQAACLAAEHDALLQACPGLMPPSQQTLAHMGAHHALSVLIATDDSMPCAHVTCAQI